MTGAQLRAGEATALVEAVTVSIATAAAEVTLVHQKSASASAAIQLTSVTTGSE